MGPPPNPPGHKTAVNSAATAANNTRCSHDALLSALTIGGKTVFMRPHAKTAETQRTLWASSCECSSNVFSRKPFLSGWVKHIGIRRVSVNKRVFWAFVKNTYLTNRPPTRVSTNVYRVFVL